MQTGGPGFPILAGFSGAREGQALVVQVRRDSYRLIRQLDHSLACGRMALAWIGADGSRLAREVAVGIGLHDFAWGQRDRDPVVDPASGDIVSFLTIEDGERAVMFADGLDRQEGIDGTAALLASLHYSRFMQQRDDPEFTAREVERRTRLLARRAADRDEAPWRRAADLLRHFDDLSLYVCLACPESEAKPDWLSEERVGARPDRGRHSLAWRDARTLELDPFPFTRELDLEIPCRDVPRRTYSSSAELQQAWEAARTSAHRVKLVRPST